MTIETDIDALISSVNARKEDAAHSKQVLSLLPSTALTARDLASSASSQVSPIPSSASALASAASAVATASAGHNALSNLSAVNASAISSAARRVFVYDTSLDSDGGAWRYKTSHTAWYSEPLNTATRGSRREFPAVAVIITTPSDGYIRIYDGDDPALPMWMVLRWNNNPQNLCVTAINGLLIIGNQYVSNASYSGNGLAIWDFPNGRLRRSTLNSSGSAYPAYYDGFISSTLFNAGPAGSWDNALRREYQLPDYSVLAVTAKVFDNAPVDQGSGLPIPKIALGTLGGVVMIHEDGSITSDNSLDWNDDVYHVSFDAANNLWFCAGSSHHFIWRYPYSANGVDRVAAGKTAYGNTLSQWYTWVGGNVKNFVHLKDLTTILPHAYGMTGYWNESMRYYRNASMFTGWMPHSTHTVAAASLLPGDVIESKNFVVNGDFSDGVNSWNYLVGSGTASVSNGVLTLDADSGATQYYLYQSIPVVVGRSYVFTQTGDGYVDLRYGTNSTITSQHSSAYFGGQLKKCAFTALAPYLYIQLRHDYGWSYKTFANISVVEGDVDRGVPIYPNQKGGIVAKGRIKKTPVASGAELMAYSNMRAGNGNWMEQEYESSLDFGTGDFCIMGWLYHSSYPPNTEPSPLYRGTDYYGSGESIWVTVSTGKPQIMLGRSANKEIITSSSTLPNSVWSHVAFIRSGSAVTIYVNGVQAGSGTSSRNLNNTSAKLYLGVGVNNSGLAWGDASLQMALWRMSAVSISPTAIEKIYSDEKSLFMPGAQCSIYGEYSGIAAASVDPVTNLIHIGTTAGRSVFDRLVRVDYTTTGVGADIHAVNGLVVEE